MITKLNHATIYIFDHDVAYDFYVTKLGFKVHTDAEFAPGMRWLTVTPPGQPDLEIILMKVAGGENSPMTEKAAELLTELIKEHGFGVGVLETDDCQADYERLIALGVTFTKPPTQEFYGLEALITDPFGNWFSMTQRA